MPQGRSGRVLEISLPLGFDPWTVQLVASCYTDYTIPAHTKAWCEEILRVYLMLHYTKRVPIEKESTKPAKIILFV
jgi:hypothetical protein